MCIVGASLGGAIVLMFALKYPSYVNMICLLAPPGEYNKQVYQTNTILQWFFINILASEQCETELIQQLRLGVYKTLLPETPDDLQAMIDTLTVKKINAPRLFINGFLDLRLRLLEEHTKGNDRHYNM
jgi:pimeloyl-ACP methyl ester carboxylesterase